MRWSKEREKIGGIDRKEATTGFYENPNPNQSNNNNGSLIIFMHQAYLVH